VASLINAQPENIYFTSGGTEANNLAILGAARFAKKKGKGNHLVTTAVEHDAVLAACRYLEKVEGFELTLVPVGRTGRVSVEDIVSAVRPETVLVSVMMANNEIGSLQPIADIGGALRGKNILFHTDAVQAVAHLEIDVQKLPLDMLSISGHKIGALKGAGALYVRSGVKLHPLQHGGAQEMTLRSGTENILGAISLGAATESIQQVRVKCVPHLKRLRDQLWEGIQATISGVQMNGSLSERLPNTISVSFEGAEGEAILLALDMEGIAASSGSACASGSVEPSHVLQAIGLPEALANNTVRFSLGQTNCEEDIFRLLDVLPKIITRIRIANNAS